MVLTGGLADQGGRVVLSRRTLYLAAAVLVIAVVAVGLYSYSRQATTNDVVIVSFEKSPAYTSGSGSSQVWYYPFTVTVANRGSNDVSGLTLTVAVLADGNVIGSDAKQLTALQVGEQYSASALVTFTSSQSLGHTLTYSATLTLGGVAMDQSSLS